MSKTVEIVDDVNYYRGIVRGISLAYELTDRLASRVGMFKNSYDTLREIQFELENLKDAQIRNVGEKVCAQH